MEEYFYYTQSIKNQFSHLGSKHVMASVLFPCKRRLFKIGVFCVLFKFLQEITLCMLIKQLCNVKQTAAP